MKKIIFFLIVLFAVKFPLSSVKDLKLYYHLKKGNNEYKKGKFDSSLSNYMKAQGVAPENPIVSFDIGNAMYKKGKFEKAREIFENILNRNRDLPEDLKENIFYNLGNCYYKLKNYEKALNYYKKALLINGKDENARKNYELTLKKLKKNNKNMNKNKNKENKKKNKDNKKNNSKNNKKKNNKKKKSEKNKKNDKKKNNKRENENKNKKTSGKRKGERKLKPREGSKVLNGLKESEKKMLQKLIKEKFKNIKKSKKDW